MSCSIRFESEQSIEEKRKIRQSEWEKVRKPEDPLTAPEVPVCNKSLFEQLQENKEKRDSEFEESRKFKNHFRGLQEEETLFLAEASTLIGQKQSEMDAELSALVKENKNLVIQNKEEPPPVMVPSLTCKSVHGLKSAKNVKKLTNLAPLVRRKRSSDDKSEDAKEIQRKKKRFEAQIEDEVPTDNLLRNEIRSETVVDITSDRLKTQSCESEQTVTFPRSSEHPEDSNPPVLSTLGGLVDYGSDCSSD